MKDTSHGRPGTGNKRVVPFHDLSEGYLQAYQTMTFHEEYRDFSLEEHRVADYRQGKAGLPANANCQLSALPFMRLSNRNPRNYRKKLDLLRGSAIEIHVGMPNSSNEDAQTGIWSLPKNLISYYSPFLQAACSWDFQETYNKRIELPEDDPMLFGLFVEWMYDAALLENLNGSQIGGTPKMIKTLANHAALPKSSKTTQHYFPSR